MARQDLRDRFERTVCACSGCRAGCRTMPGTLALGDLERIAEATGGDAQDLNWLADHFQASDGVRILRLTQRGVALVTVPTICPALVAPAGDPDDRRCVFLDDDGRCTIHDVAPYGCSHYDVHMGVEEGDQRTQAMVHELAATLDSPQLAGGFGELSYFDRYAALAAMGCRAGPAGERRERYEAELRRLDREKK